MLQPPSLPHQELFEICQSTIGLTVWAIEMNAKKDGKSIWCVFCSDEKMIERVPKTYRTRPVCAIFCEEPKMLLDACDKE